VTNFAPETTGLSGDLGWNELEQRAMSGVGVALVLAACGAYWATLWMLGGLPPLASVISIKWRTSCK